MVRIIIFTILMLIVISVLQVWLGQISALDDMKKGSDLVKHVGTLGLNLNILNLEVLNTAISPHLYQI